jgi:hypothetical protein
VPGTSGILSKSFTKFHTLTNSLVSINSLAYRYYSVFFPAADNLKQNNITTN